MGRVGGEWPGGGWGECGVGAGDVSCSDLFRYKSGVLVSIIIVHFRYNIEQFIVP